MNIKAEDKYLANTNSHLTNQINSFSDNKPKIPESQSFNNNYQINKNPQSFKQNEGYLDSQNNLNNTHNSIQGSAFANNQDNKFNTQNSASVHSNKPQEKNDTLRSEYGPSNASYGQFQKPALEKNIPQSEVAYPSLEDDMLNKITSPNKPHHMQVDHSAQFENKPSPVKPIPSNDNFGGLEQKQSFGFTNLNTNLQFNAFNDVPLGNKPPQTSNFDDFNFDNAQPPQQAQTNKMDFDTNWDDF